MGIMSSILQEMYLVSHRCRTSCTSKQVWQQSRAFSTLLKQEVHYQSYQLIRITGIQESLVHAYANVRRTMGLVIGIVEDRWALTSWAEFG